jgi:hypothetical protein
MASYARHLSEGKRNEALVDFVLGSQATGPRPPRWLMKMLLPMAIPRAARRQMLHLLDENLREHQEIARLEDSYPKYRAIEGDVLLMCGGARGSATACRTIETLATVIPHATTRRFARLDHFALQKRGMAEVAAAVADFFA